MGVFFEKALVRFQKQKADTLARDEARKNALVLKNARALCNIGKAAKRRRAVEPNPESLEAYVDAVVAWCNTPKRKRSQAPSPGPSDFGIEDECRAIDYLFRCEKFLALLV